MNRSSLRSFIYPTSQWLAWNKIIVLILFYCFSFQGFAGDKSLSMLKSITRKLGGEFKRAGLFGHY